MYRDGGIYLNFHTRIPFVINSLKIGSTVLALSVQFAITSLQNERENKGGVIHVDNQMSGVDKNKILKKKKRKKTHTHTPA